MQLVRMILIGSVLSVSHLMPGIGSANDVFSQPYAAIQSTTLDFSLAPIHVQEEPEQFVGGHETDFLLAHHSPGGYIMGIKYLDLNVANELLEYEDQSQLWLGVQFSF